MKNYKIISALALVTLLSACGSKSTNSVKAPKFAKVGEEYERVEFFDEFFDKFFSLDSFGYKRMSSKKANYRYEYIRTFTLDGEDTNPFVVTNGETVESKVQIDADNYIISYEDKYSHISETKNPNGDYEKNTIKGAYKYQAQQVEKDEIKFFADLDLITKVGYGYAPINDSNALADVFDECAKNTISYNFNLYEFYYMVGDAEQDSENHPELYKFFKNNNTYTCEFAAEEIYKSMDGENNLQYTKTTKDTAKVQATIDGNDLNLVIYRTEYEKREYAVESTYNGLVVKPGQYVESKEDNAVVLSIKDANVKLSLVDASDFEFVDY